MVFPRVIIVGETFRLNGGGGITLANLFKEWPKENIGVITDLITETDPDTGFQYYQLGTDEIRLPFPFHLVQKPIKSGPFKFTKSVGPTPQVEQEKPKTSSMKRHIFSSFNHFLHIFGLLSFFYKIRLSHGLKQWIVDFAPDIVYVQPFHHRVMRFANLLFKNIEVPYAVHIMDDSVNYINRSLIFRKSWQKLIVKDFTRLMINASVRMCISEAMAAEYKNRYGNDFLHFRNPVEVDRWLSYKKEDLLTDPDRVKIIYTGRLYSPTFSTLLDLCKVVNSLNQQNVMVEMDIYTHDNNGLFYQSVRDLKGIYLKSPVAVEDMPATIFKYDIFFLCLDFDDLARRYSQFSVSTRTSEGMVSGVPILMYGPQNSAQYRYFEKTESACLVGERNTKLLEAAVLRLWKDIEFRQWLSANALRTVMIDNNATTVRNNFRMALSISNSQ
jgi:glycosyltransferase involved in cell wall biosynthesis